MENINNTMELNNEETVNDTVDTADVIDNVLDTDEVIVADIDSGDTLKTVLKIVLIGGAVAAIAIAAKWDDIKAKRYEKRKKKMIKEAAKYGETVFITKLENGETESVEESTEEVETVEVNEN